MRESMDLTRILLLCVAFLLPTFVSAQEPAEGEGASVLPSAIHQCLDSVDEDVVGLEKLESECPGLDRALTDAGLKAYLSEDQLNTLTVYGLTDLEQLTERYRSPQSGEANAMASVDQLEPILDELKKPAQAQVPLTWFEKFKRWLRNLLNRQKDDSESWLSRWLEDLDVPQAATTWILYGSIALVIGLAIAVIINELRAAGVMQGGAKLNVPTRRGGISANREDMADLDAIDLRDRPAALLRRLVLTLVKTGRLRAERSLTHRELASRARFDATEQRRRFEQVALLGERLVYGSSAIADEDIDRVIRDGRALELELAQVEARR
jgi:hypothetical protein